MSTATPSAGVPLPREDHGRITSSTPGRLRVRIHKLYRHHLVRGIHTHLEAQPGIVAVEPNPVTGSVVVRYDPHTHSPLDVLAMLRDIGVVVRDVASAVGDDLPDIGGDGHSTTAVTAIDAITDLDRRLSAATGRRIDLKLLFPAALAALGLRQVLRGGLGLAEVPGYVLLWYAFDAFYKLHRAPAVEATESGLAPGGDGAAAGARLPVPGDA